MGHKYFYFIIFTNILECLFWKYFFYFTKSRLSIAYEHLKWVMIKKWSMHFYPSPPTPSYPHGDPAPSVGITVHSANFRASRGIPKAATDCYFWFRLSLTLSRYREWLIEESDVAMAMAITTVTRLGYFSTILAPHYRTKVAQIFTNFRAILKNVTFEEKNCFSHLWATFG